MEIAGVARCRRARARAARGSRADRPRASLPVAAVRRRAAARRAGARARQRSADRAGRRADRQSRQRATAATSWSCCSDIHRTRGTTLVLVTHDAELAALADARIVAARRPRGRVTSMSSSCGWRCARRGRRGGGCCSSSSASPSASRRSSRCGRSFRASAASSDAKRRSLIAADVLISTNRDWTPEARADDRSAPARKPARIERTETIETPTMVRPADASHAVARMVELRAVQAGVSALRHARPRGRPAVLARAARRTTARSSGRSC